MKKLIQKLLGLEEQDPDVRRRYLFQFWFLGSAAIAVALSGSWYYLHHRLAIAGTLILISALLAFLVFLLMMTRSTRWVGRLGFILLTSLFINGILMEPAVTFRMLWLYILPPMSFFFFGLIEGTLWSMLSLILMGWLVFFPNALIPHMDYSSAFDIRFFITLVIVEIIAVLSELSRYAAQEKVNLMQQKLSTHIENTPLGVIEFGLDFRITAWNHSAARIFGYTPQEAIGQRAQKLIICQTPDDQQDCEHMMHQLIEGKGGESVNLNNVTRDGAHIVCDWYNTVIRNRNGQVTGIATLINDITQETKAEKHLHDTLESHQELLKDLARKNDLKSQFLAKFSYELRSPLQAIRGIILYILENSGDMDKSVIIENIQTVFSSSNRLLDLINEIIELRYAEIGKEDVVLANIVITDLLNDLNNYAQCRIQDKPVTFSITNYLSNNFQIATDQRLLRIVLENILANSALFTKQGTISLNVFENSGRLYFKISDSGIGIPPEELSYIFDAFYQGAEEKSAGGNGLGLTISKQYVTLLDGRIWIDSRHHVGTVVTFFLPIKPADYIQNLAGITNHMPKVPERKIHTLKELDLRNKHMLVCDDDEFNLAYLGLLLKDKIGKLTVVSNGHEAIEKVQTDRFDLLLIDIHMPTMDGVKTFIKIHEFIPNTPVIAITAQAMAGDREKYLAYGFDDYLAKPFSESDLVQMISRFLVPEA